MYSCEDCKKATREEDLHRVQFAVGSTGFVCPDCLQSGRYEQEETVSPDGLASAHWSKGGETDANQKS